MRHLAIICSLFVFAVLAVACKNKDGDDASGSGSGEAKIVSLNGAGATFPFPLYSKWMAEYNRQHPNVRINYQSIGSGGGIRQVTSGTVDFGATDTPMEPAEASKTPRKVVHIPTTLGAVVVTYNLDGVKSLKLSPAVLADIVLGKITKWNDPRLQALNEGVSLPGSNVSVVARSDGSGTTAVFTDYLSKVSGEFREKVGQGKSVKWPTGLGAKGNEGVTGQVKTTPGSIGYVELAYATQNSLPVAAIENAAGEFVEPKIEAITAAAAGVEIPDSLHMSITNAEGKGAYPISAFTYILVFEDTKNEAKGRALAEFLWWATHEGQSFAAPLHYAPLPEPVVEKVEKQLKSLTAGGKPLLEEPS